MQHPTKDFKKDYLGKKYERLNCNNMRKKAKETILAGRLREAEIRQFHFSDDEYKRNNLIEFL